jgi:hypothetical protein
MSGCKYLKVVVLLVEQRGIEPLTSALRTRRSAKLSYCPTPGRIQSQVSGFKFERKSTDYGDCTDLPSDGLWSWVLCFIISGPVQDVD